MTRQKSIGIESGILRGPMTGIANYTLHIVDAMLKHDPQPRFVGFERLSWRELNGSILQEYISQSGEDSTSPPSRGLSGRIRSSALAATLRATRLSHARRIYRTIHRQRFKVSASAQRLDLFHAFNFLPPADPGVPVLPVIYDLSAVRYPELHPPDRVRWLASLGSTVERAPLIQTISEFSKREIVSVFGYPADRIFVVPPAAAPIFVRMGKDQSQLDLNSFDLEFGNFLLAVGTFEPRKNFRTLIDAYNQMPPKERSRCPLVIVGGKGWGDLDLPPQTQRLRDESSLRFLENVSNTQLRSLYEGTRLLLMPSLYEGFGMPIVEAFACGAPVAHSANTAMDEIAGDLSRRVSATDVDSWVQVLRDAIHSCDHADEEQRAARIRQARTFDWATSSDRVIAAYRQLISG